MFTVYSKPACSFCDQAKSLLKSKDLSFNEVIIDVGQPKDPAKTYMTVQELKAKLPTAKTVPQIYHGETHLGGFHELKNYLQGELV